MIKIKEIIQGRYLRYILVISFFSLVVGYLYRHPDYLLSLSQMNASQLFYLSVAVILFFAINGCYLKVILIKFNIYIPLGECFALAMANTMGNYLFARAGWVANSYYLKKRYNLPISSFIAMLGAIQITNILVISLTGLFIAVTLAISGNETVVPLLIVYMVILICVLLGIAFFDGMRKAQSSSRVLSFMLDVLQSWSIIRKDGVCLAMIALLSLAGTLLFSFRLFICYQIIDKPISYFFCILLATLVHLSTLANIIPANIGLREGIVGVASEIMGLGFESGFIATVVDRVISMLWAFFIGSAVIFFFFKEGIDQKDS